MARGTARRVPRIYLTIFVSCIVTLVTYNTIVWRHYLEIVFAPSTFNNKGNYVTAIPRIPVDKRQRPKSIPKWLLEYTYWHANARMNMDETTPILLVSIPGDGHHGGLADRLRSIPFFLWEASQTKPKRLLLMQWKTPCAIEEFLLPPPGGIDWTVPTNLLDYLSSSNNDNNIKNAAIWYKYESKTSVANKLNNKKFENITIVQIHHTKWTFETGMKNLANSLSSINGESSSSTSLSSSSSWWNDESNKKIFSYMFKLMLEPSPPVQTLLDNTMKRLGLTPQNYDAVHLRARYPGISDSFSSKALGFFGRGVDADGFRWTLQAKKETGRLVTHAIDCIRSSNITTTTMTSLHVTTNNSDTQKTTNSNILKKFPIYLASDTNEAVKFATTTKTTRQDNQNANDNIVGYVTSYEKFHLDRNDRIGLGLRKTPPSAFYPAFVDFLILSMSRCISIGQGGYGLVASVFGGIDCVVFYQSNRYYAKASTSSSNSSATSSSIRQCYFL